MTRPPHPAGTGTRQVTGWDTPPQSEEQFTDTVLDYARWRRWRTLHIRPGRTKDSWRTPVQGDGVGWPDIFMARNRRLVACELKVGRARPTGAQKAWLTDLAFAGVECHLWYPKDWPLIEEVLR